LFEMVLVDRLRSRPPLPLVAAGVACVGVSFGLLPLGASVGFALFTVLLWTLGEMLESPQMWAFVANRAPDHKRGGYIGLYVFAFSAAGMTAPILGTQVWKHWGPHRLWLACAAAASIAVGGYLLLAQRVAREPPRAL
jgi:predicted MFS family arabinose efflux permease